MARFNQILVLSAISLIALAGCDSVKEASTPQTSSAPVPAATAVKTEKAASQGNYAELSGVVSSTNAAVQAETLRKPKPNLTNSRMPGRKLKTASRLNLAKTMRQLKRRLKK